jgi:uncharacterized membrane protein (GlpM family)
MHCFFRERFNVSGIAHKQGTRQNRNEAKSIGWRLTPLLSQSGDCARESSLIHEVFIRFLIGGLIVSAFAALGGLFKPKTFAGLFGAAPSVALATLTLTVNQNGISNARVQARSMLMGAVAFFLYSVCVVVLLKKCRVSALGATLSAMVVWLCTSFGLWFLFLR